MREKDKNGMKREHVKQIDEKTLHNEFWRATENVCGTKFWAWLKRRQLEKETEPN